MKMLTVLSLFILGLNINIAAQEAKKIYTQEEFNKALIEELEKKMKQVGRSKMIDFSKSLLEKEESIKVKELDIAKKEEQLKINEEDFKKKVQSFKEEQKKFIACLDDVDQKEKTRIDNMVAVVSGMRPQNAADLLSQQEAEISVKIISELDPAKTSKIFNLMDKEISARLQKLYLKMRK